MKKLFALYFTLFVLAAPAQSGYKKLFPVQGASLQFAGSVGFLSAGYHVRTPKEHIELALRYGYTPEAFGGPLHSVSLKVLYSPFHLKFLKHYSWEPLQGGIFLSQNFGENLYVMWPEKYPKHYYWWSPSLREHIFLSTQVSYSLQYRHLDKISAYFEANTNDLYLYSFIPNRGALSLYDITFFGLGLKADFR
jgi:hypothetical protein